MIPCPSCQNQVDPLDAFCPNCGHSMRTTPSTTGTGGSSRGGRSGMNPLLLAGLIGCGCFGAIAFLGIVSAILIPNLVDALQKAKSKRTIATLRDLSTELEVWYSEHGSYPSVASAEELPAVLGMSADFQAIDGWETPLLYACQPSGDGCSDFRLLSAGRDAAFESNDPFNLEAATFEPFEYDSDIVVGPGGFLRYPQ